jgi:hypothetical protein
MRASQLIAATACALGLLACAQDSEFERNYADVGEVCLRGQPDAPHSVDVDFATCLSSSCDTVVESMCEATLSGNELTITATATVSVRDGACTSDCQALQAFCETEPLPPGNYDVIYGEARGTLTVPSDTTESTCIGEGL